MQSGSMRSSRLRQNFRTVTVYELALTIPRLARDRLAAAGVLSGSLSRHLYIYEMYQGIVCRGVGRMDAYAEVSARCFTSEDNVRKIVYRLSREVGE